MKLVIAIGGSSGSIYAARLLTKLKHHDEIHADLTMSTNALVNWQMELADTPIASFGFNIFDNKDFFAPFASGSAMYDAMIVIPSSMGLIGRIAHGISDDLITRAADVMLKERRRLIIVPRECPYNLIHLKNMTMITEAGGIICPASPSFYSKPTTIEAAVDTVVDRVIDLIGLRQHTYRWGEKLS